ncbi:MAG: CvpA family protein [Clostridiales bacterium]|nr:CvpA family protein [Clostridiales bacterium]
MNIIDIAILAVLAVSVLYGMYRGFISGVLSVAALIGSAALAFSMSGQLAAWLQGNQTLVSTLVYYTDAGSRIGDLELSLLPASQVTQTALARILSGAKLPSAFESAFLSALGAAPSAMTVSDLLSNTIVSVSLSILSFLICFLLSYIVLSFVIHLINYVFELPVLRHLDALAGGLFGLVRGALLLFILFALVPIVLAVAPVEPLQAMIDQSRLAPLFDSRIILSILGGL